MDKYYEKLHVKLHVEKMGEDLCVTICGGDRPHIGSIAIADPRESLSGDGSISATVSTFNFTGHKDDVVANRIAFALSAKQNCRVVVLCGLHYNSISPGVIREIMALAESITEFIENFSNLSNTSLDP